MYWKVPVRAISKYDRGYGLDVIPWMSRTLSQAKVDMSQAKVDMSQAKVDMSQAFKMTLRDKLKHQVKGQFVALYKSLTMIVT